jgi:transposase InsO family protein
LELKRLLGWTRAEAAATLLVCPNTIGNWESQVEPGTTTVGSTVKPNPPIVRMKDAVRSLVQSMKRLGFGSDDLLAMTLVRAGWKISARTVGRIVREALRPEPVTPPPAKPQRPVKALFFGHVFMADGSEVRGFLGATFHMATIFDAFSRVPLVFQVFDHKPDSVEMKALLHKAVKAFGKPKYLITDLGPEFQGAFRKALRRLGVVQRFRRKDYIAGTARLESFWRTLKNTASLRLPIFLTLEDLERRLAPALVHYTWFRPHHGLHGATPAEAFLGLEPALKMAKRAPRGRPGEGSLDVPFHIAFLDDHEKRFPVLLPAAA